MSQQEKFLTYEQVAELMQLSTCGLRNRFSRREPMPPSVKVGRRRLFPEREFYEWMRQHQETDYPQTAPQFR